MINIIQEYLASIGFKVDQKSFNEANKALDSVEKKVNAFGKAFNNAVKSIGDNKIVRNVRQDIDKFIEKVGSKIATFLMTVRGFILAASVVIIGAVVAIVAAVTAATYKFMANIAKADMAIQVFARRMFTTVENARSLKAVMDSMGVGSLDELKDVAMNPELRQQFFELRQLSAGLGLDDKAQEGMRNIRAVEYEFQKLSLLWNYFLQSFAGELGQVMAGPLSAFKGMLADINMFFTVQMKTISHNLAAFLGIFAKLGEMVARLIYLLSGFDALLFTDSFNSLGILLDLINSVLDAINSVLDGLGKMRRAGFESLFKGMDSLIPSNGDMYKDGQNAFKTLAYYVQRIYELLSQVWNFVGGHLKRFADFAQHPIERAGDAVSNLLFGASAEAATSGTSSSSPSANPAKTGRLNWATRDKASQAINEWLNEISPNLTSNFNVTAAHAHGGHSPGSKHYQGLALDIGGRGKSAFEFANIIQEALKLNSTRNLNLEFLPKKYAAIMAELKNRGLDKDPRLTHDTRFMQGEHLHVGLKPMQVTIHINGAGKNKEDIAKEVKRELQNAAYRSQKSNGGAFG